MKPVTSSLAARTGAFVSLFALCACHDAEPRLSSAQIERVREALPGITGRCLEKLRYNGIDAFPNRVDQCFMMSPPRRWRGTWHDGFEDQRFCPEMVTGCAAGGEPGSIWITFVHGKPTKGPPSNRSYIIEFIGRGTVEPGHFGHMGIFSNEVVVDKMIAFSSSGGQ